MTGNSEVRHTSLISELLINQLLDIPDWQLRGNCATDGLDVDQLWDQQEQEAVARCSGCPSLQPCLEYAEEKGVTSGVWGGKPFWTAD